ncbi:hypothetical protein [Mucilaginibacter lappiensis]|uniref:nSTAND1 domain-containing NTPase n=1 Tax=Mucilaginibacter lappiensis TaxID=354630 RepID=UPI003D1D0DE6
MKISSAFNRSYNNVMALGFRYPGIKPFSIEDQDLFFGRDGDINTLFKLICVEQLIVLYSKSGLGKSSILNAGITPKLRETGNFDILNVRFGVYRPENQVTPLETLLEKTGLDSRYTNVSPDNTKNSNTSEAWHALKAIQKSTGNKNILIIIDQFEELFTYPEAQIIDFKKQLAEVLYVNIPQGVRIELEKQMINNPQAISDDDLKFLFEPLNVKVLMSIRSDKMSLLNNLKDCIPGIYGKTYELMALDISQAKDAILKPAYKREETFLSPPFDISNDALDQILLFLTKDGKQKIESFQLQIICQFMETLAIEKGLRIIGTEHLGDINDIFENYYDNLISKLPTAEDQQRARVFIEEKLIFEEDKTRLSIYEQQILRDYNVSKTLLAELVNSHLVRAEPNTAGALSYELSHDTLVDPILKAKAKRLEKLKIEEDEQRLTIERDLAAKQRKKLRNTQLLLACISVLAIISIVACVYAVSMKNDANESKKSIETMNKQLDKSNHILTNTADDLRLQKDKTIAALQKADSAKLAAENQVNITRALNRQLAVANAQLKKRAYEKFDGLFQSTIFMQSKLIDTALKQQGRSLCLEYFLANETNNYNFAVSLLNNLAKAADLSVSEQYSAMYQIKVIYDKNKNSGAREKNIINLVGLPVFNDVSKKQEILPIYDASRLHTTAFAFSPDRTKFAYNVEEGVVTGQLVADSLKIDYIPSFKHGPHLTSIGLNNAGEIVAREKGHLVYSVNGEKRLLALPVDSSAICKLSPDGSILFTRKDNVPLLWKTSALIKGQQANPISFKDFNQTVYLTAFSPDNQLIAVGHVDGVSIFDFTGKLVSTRTVTGTKIYYEAGKDRKVPVQVYVTALNFSRDSKSIIIGTSQQEVMISNLYKVQTSGQMFDFKEKLNYIGSVSLSPDDRNILAGSANDGKYIVLNIPGGYFKKLPIDTNVIYANFLSSNTVLSVGYHGKVTTYRIFPKFNSLPIAIAEVQILDSSVFKKSNLSNSPQFDLMLSNDPQLLHNRGSAFQKTVNNKDSLIKAKQIFTRLVTITKENPVYDYLEHLIDVNTSLNELESKNYFAKVVRLKENITLFGDVLRLSVSDDVNAVTTKSLSNDWGNLAYNQLFIKNYKEAILSSQNGLQLVKTNDWIYTNLALGYLLIGEFDKAKAIYLQYKDKNFYQSKNTFKKTFIDDLVDLESEDIITAEDTELYAHVKQIRDLLK